MFLIVFEGIYMKIKEEIQNSIKARSRRLTIRAWLLHGTVFN